MKKYVLGFMFVGDNCVLIERTKDDWQCGLVNGIGGKIEDNEDPYDAMIREFEEEAGVHTHYHEWNHVITLDNSLSWIIYVFRGDSSRHFDLNQFCDEGKIGLFHTCPENMEQTARWLYYMCVDKPTHDTRKNNEPII